MAVNTSRSDKSSVVTQFVTPLANIIALLHISCRMACIIGIAAAVDVDNSCVSVEYAI